MVLSNPHEATISHLLSCVRTVESCVIPQYVYVRDCGSGTNGARVSGTCAMQPPFVVEELVSYGRSNTIKTIFSAGAT